MITAARTLNLTQSPTLAISAKAEALKKAGQPIINLSVGELDFLTPDYIKQAAIAAINDNYTRYTASSGILPLRQKIAELLSESYYHYTAQQIVVSNGAKQAIYNLMQAILNKGDEVIISAPYWASYPDMVQLQEAVPVIITTSIEQNFKITAAQLRKALTPKTKLFILNSPSNPTGMLYSQEELRSLAAVLRDYPKVLILSDDIYKDLIWVGSFSSILAVAPDLYERTFIVHGVSKSYAMTGWRIGYIAGPLSIMPVIEAIQSHSSSNACSISQYAALAALTTPSTFITEVCTALAKRALMVTQLLSQIPTIKILPPQGAFYVFLDCQAYLAKHPNMDDIALADALLTKAQIAVVPGSAFGSAGHLRLSFALSTELLSEAIARIKQFFLTN